MSTEKVAHQDFTQGPVSKAIVALAIPMVLEMCMESIFAVVDVFFVGKLGADAVATVGLTESLLTIVYTVAMGLSIGAAAVTSRRIGEGDADGAAVATVQSLFLGLGVSIVIAVIGIFFTEELLLLMGASPGVIEQGSTYCRIMLGGSVVVLLLFLANAAFRGAGDAWIAMRSLWIANALNVVLCFLLIHGIEGVIPSLGVTGAAIATTSARGAGAIYVIWKMLKGGGRLHVMRKHLRPSPMLMKSIARLSVSGTFQMFIGTASWIALIRVMSNFGSEALAGYTIGIRILLFALLPAFGLGNAAATMVGQSLGARDPDRGERAVWIASFYGAIFLGAIGVLFFVGANPLVSHFTEEPEVLRYAVECLRIVAIGYPFYAYGMIVTQAFNGAGDTWTPTWLNFFVFWLFEIPLAYVWAFHTDIGPQGVFYSIAISFTVMAGIAVLLFKRGAWKLKAV